MRIMRVRAHVYESKDEREKSKDKLTHVNGHVNNPTSYPAA